MKKAVITITVCFLFLCGCLTVEEANPAGGSGPPGGSGPVRASREPEKIGVIFEWSSAVTPMTGSIGVDSPVASGFPGVDFRLRSTAGRTLATEGGGFRLGMDNRLVIGGAANGATSAGNPVPGVFNLSEGKFRLTIDYKDPVASPDWYLFRIYINNNSTGQAESVLGNHSVIGYYTSLQQLETGTGRGNASDVTQEAEPGRITLTLTPGASYAGASPAGKNSIRNAFFALLCQMDSRITVTGIKIERIE